ncbi:hypothetical protein [Primorskyibacter sp. S87]
MKAFLAACAAMVIITISAPFVLEQMGYSAADRTASGSVRLD